MKITELIIVVGDDPQKFEEELNQAIGNGFQPYGEYHYLTYLDDASGRVEQWSMAMVKTKEASK